MSSTLRVSVGRFFDRVARLDVSRARAVAPPALAALVFAARRPVRGVLALVVSVSVLVAAVVRDAFPLPARVVVEGVALPLADVEALARPFPAAPARPVVPPPVPLAFDPLLVATANLLARLPALWRRRRPLRVMYPQVGRS